MDAAQSKISSCLWAHSSTFCVLHCSHASSFFRNIPSPEHGASTMILVKYSLKCSARRCGVSFVTTALAIPMRSIFSERIFARAGWISLLMRIPLPAITAAICVLFPPGAAHKSRIRSPAPSAICRVRYAAGAMALGSWI